ncbi:MAG: EscR/YscR/HrcR family type III secretion system export apparatus protein, partial [Myxococcales bacterium]|nr:EscR/YscR/HrcR family type III secretion system export apparatus protein [Myxococcales bacterium]
AKAAVVLGVLRGGLGARGLLPGPVLLGLAAVLAAVVMAPVASALATAVDGLPADDPVAWARAAATGWPILDHWLSAHTRPEDLAALLDAARTLDPAQTAAGPALKVAAFMVTELTAAFQLGVLLLLPFLIVDLLTANTLTALGFHQLSVRLVSLPFKLLLFVAADGWSLLVRGFVRSYAA